MAKFLSMAGKTKVAASFGANTGKRKLDAWVPGTAGNTTSTVELSISCRNLTDMDILSKSDPMCVIYHRPPGSKNWVQLLRTEVIDNDLDPDFVTKATMEYRFEQVQSLRFEVYDIDSGTIGYKLSSEDILGFVETNLGQIVSNGEEGLTLELNSLKGPVIPPVGMAIQASNKPPQTIILIAEELASEKDEVLLKLQGCTLGSWSGCMPPRTLFLVSKMNDAGKYLLVHRSKTMRGANPTWPPLKISCRNLCNGDLKRQLKIEIFQRPFHGRATSLGFVTVTLGELIKGNQDKMQLMTAGGASGKGFLKVLSCGMTPISTFVDYVQSGTQIQCCFAIDFTCSNGDPADPVSLHYISNITTQPNPYEQAMQAVGSILKDYDVTNLFPTWGFGARIPPKGDISHCFPVSLSKSPNCCSVPGVLETYRSCISKIQLYGPTNFAPVINQVAKLAEKSKGGERYYILVIITDGVISDMVKTKKAIVQASALPMSIIIIGVGEVNFEAMEELDSDAVPLTYKRKRCQRDIVQFVAYRNARLWMACTGESTVTEISLPMDDIAELVEGEPGARPATGAAAAAVEDTPDKTAGPPEDSNDRNNRLAQSQLAHEVLAEIPAQLTGYMKAKGILPGMINKPKAKGPAKPAEGKEGETIEAPVTTV